MDHALDAEAAHVLLDERFYVPSIVTRKNSWAPSCPWRKAITVQQPWDISVIRSRYRSGFTAWALAMHRYADMLNLDTSPGAKHCTA